MASLNLKTKGNRKGKAWKVSLHSTFWIVWRQRNRFVFEDEALNIQKWKMACVSNFWSWMRVILGDHLNTLVGFIDWPDN